MSIEFIYIHLEIKYSLISVKSIMNRLAIDDFIQLNIL